MNEDLMTRIANLENEIQRLKASTTIPLDIASAFEARIGVSPQVSSRAAQTRAVNESGSSSYNVAKAMDGFITINVNGVAYYIPFYA